MTTDVRPETSRTIRLEDIDAGVIDFFNKVVDASVTMPSGERRKVDVKFSSGERWVAASDQSGVRDRDGRLILPVIQISRNGINMTDNRTALGSNVPRLQLASLVSEKTSDLANLDSLRPISSRRLRGSAVYDIFTIPFPSNNTLPYAVKIQTQYVHHINEIVEKLLSELEFFTVPSFVISLAGDHRERGIPSGEGSTELLPEAHSIYESREPLSDYYVVGYIEGDVTDSGNLNEFTDQERIIQLQFNFMVPTVLMLDPAGERPAVQRERTAFTVSMGTECVHVVDDPAEADRIFGPK